MITAIVTNLDSEVYRRGTIICPEAEKVTDLVIVAKGRLDVFGYYKYRGERHKMLVMHLPKRSWYGDF